MLAVIAGTGALPAHLMAARPDALLCEMEGFPVEGHEPALTFRLETLGSFMAALSARGVSDLCFAGAIARVPLDPSKVDAATLPLVPRVLAALQAGGDDAALRMALSLFEERGFTIRAAHDIAPDLMPAPGLLCGTLTPDHEAAGAQGMGLLALMSQADLGQGCVIHKGRVIAVEAAPGTDWMLASLANGEAWGGCFIKAPKQGQDPRIDMPTIGPDTITAAARAGLSAVIIAAGGVQVLDRDATIGAAEAAGMTLWVRT